MKISKTRVPQGPAAPPTLVSQPERVYGAVSLVGPARTVRMAARLHKKLLVERNHMTNTSRPPVFRSFRTLLGATAIGLLAISGQAFAADPKNFGLNPAQQHLDRVGPKVVSAHVAAVSAGPPPCTRNRPSIKAHWKPGRSPSALTCQILARSSLSITGLGSTIWRQEAGEGASRFCSGPMLPAIEVTSSSRIASSGGLVTWANSWVK